MKKSNNSNSLFGNNNTSLFGQNNQDKNNKLSFSSKNSNLACPDPSQIKKNTNNINIFGDLNNSNVKNDN